MARTSCKHKLFELCRRRRDGNNDDDGSSRLIIFPSLQLALQQLSADLQLHEMCSDSGDDGRRRHVLSSLHPSTEAPEANDISMLSIIDDLSIITVDQSPPMVSFLLCSLFDVKPNSF